MGLPIMGVNSLRDRHRRRIVISFTVLTAITLYRRRLADRTARPEPRRDAAAHQPRSDTSAAGLCQVRLDTGAGDRVQAGATQGGSDQEITFRVPVEKTLTRWD